MLFAPGHLVSLFTLGIPSGLVMDLGYKETLVLPVCATPCANSNCVSFVDQLTSICIASYIILFECVKCICLCCVLLKAFHMGVSALVYRFMQAQYY